MKYKKKKGQNRRDVLDFSLVESDSITRERNSNRKQVEACTPWFLPLRGELVLM